MLYHPLLTRFQALNFYLWELLSCCCNFYAEWRAWYRFIVICDCNFMRARLKRLEVCCISIRTFLHHQFYYFILRCCHGYFARQVLLLFRRCNYAYMACFSQRYCYRINLVSGIVYCNFAALAICATIVLIII